MARLRSTTTGGGTLPYLSGGSGGIGMVIDQYTAHRGNKAFADAAGGIRLAANSGLYAQAGLFHGRAGMIACVASARHACHAGEDNGPEAAAHAIGTHVDRLAWHAIRYGGGLAFPGDMLLRLSMDLGTGTRRPGRPPRSPHMARCCRSSPGPQASPRGRPRIPRRPFREPNNQALTRR